MHVVERKARALLRKYHISSFSDNFNEMIDIIEMSFDIGGVRA